MHYFATSKLGWVFRPVHREDDFGIDGYADVVENDCVTGRSLAFQVKSGRSYFSEATPGGFKYRGSKAHLNLYLNLDLPVILLIVDEKNEDAYWVEFDIEKTSPSGDSWWIEIPKCNFLTPAVRTSWAAIAGATVDYSQEIQDFWALSEAIRNHDFLALAIPKGDVEDLSMHAVERFFAQLARNTELLVQKRNSVEIFFPDYDDEPRELLEVPEFRAWMRKSIEMGVPWFYFLNTRGMTPSLSLLYVCGCEVTLINKADGKCAIESAPHDRKWWIEANFANLNAFTETHRLAETINKQVTENVSAVYYSMFNRSEQEMKRRTQH